MRGKRVAVSRLAADARKIGKGENMEKGKSINHLQLIQRAFDTLRKKGFFAGVCHSCCGSCGVAEVPADKKKYVFFHSQDADAFFDDELDDFARDEKDLVSKTDGRLRRTLYLNFSSVPDGKVIVKALEKEGLYTEWASCAGVRIAVEP
jgi:hypothetical protein